LSRELLAGAGFSTEAKKGNEGGVVALRGFGDGRTVMSLGEQGPGCTASEFTKSFKRIWNALSEYFV
jgi:hypothetical protein